MALTKKMLKFGVVAAIAILFSSSGVLFLSAYFANFTSSVQNFDITLDPLEKTNTEFSLSIDSFYGALPPPSASADAPYYISPAPVCNFYDSDFNCIDQEPNLCPYISLEPEDGEATETGFIKNPNGYLAHGLLNRPDDETDDWTLSVESPCFEGQCPSDYNENINGAPLPQTDKGKTFKCNLFVESDEIPELVRYFSPNKALADTAQNSIEVSAVFTGESNTCTENCFSNVLFLPGIMGSRLYEQEDETTDNELWLSTSDSDHAKLSLNDQGESINAIYTKNDTLKLFDSEGNETGIVDEIFGSNIYNSFVDDLKKWKDDDKIIEDYAFIPYDWRLSLDDIITNGSADGIGNLSYTEFQDFSDSFILEKLEALQSNSRTGKVTIIAHSNGGLVVKALIQKLKDTANPLYDKIDKIIFVAVPQVGTPDATVALLHGSNLGLGGFIMDNKRYRQLSEDMPTVYNLLPSEGYFTTVDPGFAVDKVASFENVAFFNPQISQYGVFISNATELKNYILGTDGRSKPSFGDTKNPNIGNSDLYAQAEDAHEILDPWQPSPSTKIIQVAGWGEETIAGIDYKTKKGATETISYKPRLVVDGDGTVVVPSALWMSTSSPNVERWWVDLWKYNDENSPDRVHRSILEVDETRDFIKNEIKNNVNENQTYSYVTNDYSNLSQEAVQGERLHYTLHSPLTLGIMDVQGRYTGQDPVTKEIKEEIPGVNYRQIGEIQFISAPVGITYTLELKGYEQGDFALDVDKQQGNTITDFTSFQGIPSSTSTLATMEIVSDFEVGSSSLKIDQNGDGIVDTTLQATPNGTTIYDVTPPELQVTFDINTQDVVFSAQDILDPHPTITTTNTSITLTDNAGNTTVIPFTKLRELPTRLRLTYNKIIRNGITTNVPNTHIVYDWQDKKGVLTDLDTKVVVKGVERNIFNYKKVNNATIIRERTSSGLVITTKPGFVVVTVETEEDGLRINY